MSQIEIVFGYTKKIEALLLNKFKAEGRGLHTKLNSVEAQFPDTLIKKIRWIATIRNNLAHTEGFSVDSLDELSKVCDSVIAELEAIAAEPANSSFQAKLALVSREKKASNIGSPAPVMHPQTLAKYPGNKLRSTFSDRNNVKPSPVAARGWPRTKNIESKGKPKPWVPLIVLMSIGFGGAGWFYWDSLPALSQRNQVNLASVKNPPQPDLDLAYQDLEENFFGFISHNTEILLSQQELEKNRDGTHNVRVLLRWTIPEKQVISVLNQYFSISSKALLKPRQADFNLDKKSSYYGIIIPNTTQENDGFNKYHQSLLNFLNKHQINIRVAIGQRSQKITIATGRACREVCGGIGTDQYQIHLSNSLNPKQILLSGLEGRSNPVMIRGATEEEFKTIKSITTSIEVINISDNL